MIRTLLFDLDDTLLINESFAFFRNYVGLLAPHLATWVSEEELFTLMWRSTEAMMANSDPCKLTLACFWEAVEALGHPPEEMAPGFERFYETDYEQLRNHTAVVPGSRELLEWASAQGYQLVIATAPIFPDAAIRKRLEWANVSGLPYVLVTSCENMHFGKPNPLYYQEIVDMIQRRPEECLMVGNDIRLDMVAGQVGIKTYLVTDDALPPETLAQFDGQGSLAGVRSWLEAQQAGSSGQ